MRFRVDIIESERGWGQKIDGHRDFETIEEADTFVIDFNKDNNLDHVPDWYMYAKEPRIIRK